jgi:hypothetical protein
MNDLEQSANEQNSEEVAEHEVDQSAEDQQDDQADDQMDSNDLDEDSQEQPDEEETEEIEVGDKKIVVPKSAAEKLKAERLMQQDYTRKTQELAADREKHKEDVQQRETFMREYAEVVALDQQIAKLKEIDLTQYVDTDPVGVQRIQIELQKLEAKRSEAVNGVTQKQQQYALQQQQEIAKLEQDAEAYVQREIKDWSPTRAKEVSEFAQKSGVKMDQATALTVLRNPALLAIFDKAEKFDRLAAKTKAPKPPAPPPKPATRVSSGRATVNTDPDKMSPEQYREWRNKGRK